VKGEWQVILTTWPWRSHTYVKLIRCVLNWYRNRVCLCFYVSFFHRRQKKFLYFAVILLWFATTKSTTCAYTLCDLLIKSNATYLWPSLTLKIGPVYDLISRGKPFVITKTRFPSLCNIFSFCFGNWNKNISNTWHCTDARSLTPKLSNIAILLINYKIEILIFVKKSWFHILQPWRVTLLNLKKKKKNKKQEGLFVTNYTNF
jgi:hypothetical protein